MLMLTSPNPSIAIPTGMVAGWSLEDVANGYSDFVGGKLWVPGGSAPTVAAGVIGHAASFDGAGRLTTPDAANIRLASGIAVEAWVYRAGAVADQCVISKDAGITPRREWSLFVSPSYIQFAVFSTTTTFAALQNTGAPLNTWVHLVGTFTGTNARIYRNGVLAATSGAFSGTIAGGNGSCALSQAVNEGSYAFTGRIDEPRIWQFGVSGDPGAAFWLSRYNAGVGWYR